MPIFVLSQKLNTMLEHKENVHIRRYEMEQNGTIDVLLISDAHWDNPKCDRYLLRWHMDEAVEKGARILFNGDTFCLMQGAYDPRKSKSDIRPEHNKANYFDAIVDTAVEFFAPYAQYIDFFGYGNHETSILKRQETDILSRFVEKLNNKCKTDIGLGGYGGWYVSQFAFSDKISYSHKIRYFHGSGGGGPVTKGTIQHNRAATMYAGADLIWMGHVHESYEVEYVLEYLNARFTSCQKSVLMVRTPTYKEEYGTGHHGWHVERGASPKPLGGRWLRFTVTTTGVKAVTFKTI